MCVTVCVCDCVCVTLCVCLCVTVCVTACICVSVGVVHAWLFACRCFVPVCCWMSVN